MGRNLTGTRQRKRTSVAAEAHRIGVSEGWIYARIRERRFPHTRAGGRVLLDPDEVDRFLAATSVGLEEALQREADAVAANR